MSECTFNFLYFFITFIIYRRNSLSIRDDSYSSIFRSPKMEKGEKTNHAKAWRSAENFFEFLRDLVIFICLSSWYILESIFLTILPKSLRTLKPLNGQVALITGGGSGLGRILAQRLARLQCTVVIWDINKEGNV